MFYKKWRLRKEASLRQQIAEADIERGIGAAEVVTSCPPSEDYAEVKAQALKALDQKRHREIK